ncbi:probable regulator of nonsense transcripts 3A at N-terminal half [Coccomyxa sp. Obi]|nr:probable regulator of nonsense transcripts 3A at N-terminal half [Coccomyxa sp. Obi]
MERTKVVIRKLPPNVAEDDVRDLVNKIAAKYTWFSFVQGKTSVRRVVHSRCYVNFEDPAGIPAFKAAVEGHAFVTDRGSQFRGCVEYAPFQKVPEGKPKRDPREGTFEKDPDFLAFVESLSAQPEALPSGDAVGSSGQKAGEDSGPQITALMAYLQEKHSLKKKPPAIMKRTKQKAADDANEYSRAAPKILSVVRRAPEKEETLLQDREKASARRSSKASSASRTEQGTGAKQAEGAAPSKAGKVAREGGASEDKPVRVRAGFQVYQPKRVSRLSTMEESGSDAQQQPGSAKIGAAKSGPTTEQPSAATSGKDGDAAAGEMTNMSSSEKSTRTAGSRRRAPQEARQNPKGSASKPMEPG